MKILYKPKMLPVECARCGCVFAPKRKHLTTAAGVVKDKVLCPICVTPNPANFERKTKAKEVYLVEEDIEK